ncbi:protein translocase subunit SecD [Pontibacillus yanchengensis]|uniref:Protein translocase subunit SecD n=2 Tax=Pontibacillus yanchengensis TaxID=462910 RepID=A0ACC7VH15_9BACI|nr:protein translocase subunit SecD [Pontibacillus yanchengensis]MYL33346.1 protein translocase subunit SecD [Pontibacillus yanchengensis]MYL53395.1 protein translocase subunit SecD [Pontibacillus yanchengensis]
MIKRSRIVAFFLLLLIFAGTIGTTIQGISKDIRLGLDLQGGFEILYEVKPIEEGQEINRDVMEATVETIYRRVDALGISETNVSIEEEDRIRVQLAGIDDQQKARELLSTSARLSFRTIDDDPIRINDQPLSLELEEENEPNEPDTEKGEIFNGSNIVEGSAQQAFNQQTNAPMVTLKVKNANDFAKVTEKVAALGDDKSTPAYSENSMVIWMDFDEGDSYLAELQKPTEEQKFISAPRVSERLMTSDVQITGNFTVEEAKELANIINAGSLPVDMEEKFSTSVGAQFGAQAMNKTIVAGAIGIGLIFIFMMLYYRLPGVVAVITLSLYVYLILQVFEWMNGVLTLPGIAALVLGVGMAVDANIITYERIKEELKAGKSTLSAFKSGNSRSLATILDANITTLLAAVVLFAFGTSSVKGFATMLILSIIVSFITAVYGSRLLLGLWVNSRALNKKPRLFGVKQKDIKNIEDGEEVEAKVLGREFDFVKNRKKFFGLSVFLVLAGAIVIAFNGLNLGIDFTNGSRVQVLAENTIDVDEIEQDFENLGLNPEKINSSGDNNEIAVARFDEELTKDKIAEIRTTLGEKYGSPENINTSIVSPIVAQELVKNAVYAVAIASIGIIIYVTIRFEFYFALTAIVALLHDAFFIIALFSITRLEFDITIIAAILTIVGYSVNDTIVTFDRIRENLKLKKRVRTFKELSEIVNRSLMQTLPRSINTVLTVIFAALMLMLFGATSITNFSFALVVGLIAGTYSSLFIAAQLWLVWRGSMLDKKPIQYVEKKKTGGPQV